MKVSAFAACRPGLTDKTAEWLRGQFRKSFRSFDEIEVRTYLDVDLATARLLDGRQPAGTVAGITAMMRTSGGPMVELVCDVANPGCRPGDRIPLPANEGLADGVGIADLDSPS